MKIELKDKEFALISLLKSKVKGAVQPDDLAIKLSVNRQLKKDNTEITITENYLQELEKLFDVKSGTTCSDSDFLDYMLDNQDNSIKVFKSKNGTNLLQIWVEVASKTKKGTRAWPFFVKHIVNKEELKKYKQKTDGDGVGA